MLKFWILTNLTKGSHHTDLFKNLRDDSNQFLEFWLRSLGMTLLWNGKNLISLETKQYCYSPLCILFSMRNELGRNKTIHDYKHNSKINIYKRCHKLDLMSQTGLIPILSFDPEQWITTPPDWMLTQVKLVYPLYIG